MTRIARRGLVIATALLLGTSAATLADPLDLHLTDREDWMELGPAGGDVTPVRDWNDGLEELYPGEQAEFREPQLYILDNLTDESGAVLDHHPGLVMAWGDPTENAELIGAWDLQLPVDPDLTGTCITLTAWPRLGMTSISFMLQDANGVMKGWTWPVGAGGLPPDQATTLTVRAAGGAGQAGSTGYFDHGIDLHQVQSFEFAESGMAQPPGIPLPYPLIGFVGQWNYWHDIMVLSCPDCAVRLRADNGFGNGGGDGMPGQSGGRGNGRGHGPIDDSDR